MRARGGPVGRAIGGFEDVVAAVRRRQQGREPRVVLYDAGGHARVVAPASEGHEALLEAAERIVRLAPERGERSSPGDR